MAYLDEQMPKFDEQRTARERAERMAEINAQALKDAQERTDFTERLRRDFGRDVFKRFDTIVTTCTVPCPDEDYDAIAVLKFEVFGEKFYLLPGNEKRHEYHLYYRPLEEGNGQGRSFYAGNPDDPETTWTNLMEELSEALSDIGKRREYADRREAEKAQEEAKKIKLRGPYRYDQAYGDKIQNVLNELHKAGYKVIQFLYQQSEPGYNGEVVVISRKKVFGIF